MLKFNQCTLPAEALKTLRLQSFALWQQGAYRHFEANGDAEILRWVKQLNAKFTTTHKEKFGESEAYYAGLLKKYNMDGKLKW